MSLSIQRKLAFAFAAAALLTTPALADVNVYTTREPGLIKPLLEAFTAKTGIAVNTVFVEQGLPERVAAEGANSPADVLMTVDIGNLIDLVDKGVTQSIHSAPLEEAVPANLRDPNGNWFALSLRARVLYVAKTPISHRLHTNSSPTRRGKARSAFDPDSTPITPPFLQPSSRSMAQKRRRSG